MDIRVKTILDFIQGQKGYENAVIAGGAIRDYHYELEPKDYDIFIPLETRQQSVKHIITLINKEFNLGLEGKEKGKEYEDAKSLRGVTEITFEGKVFDIIGKPAKNDETFGFEVIKDFDFGNSMAFYNGLYVEDSNEHWKADVGRSRMTLVNMTRLSDLPRHMERFNRFNKRLLDGKGWMVSFDSSCLSLRKSSVVDDLYTRAGKKAKLEIGGVWNPAGEIVLPNPGPEIGFAPPQPARQRIPIDQLVAGVQRDQIDFGALQNAGPARGADGRFQRRDAERANGARELGAGQGVVEAAAPVDWAGLVQGQVINVGDIRPVGRPIRNQVEINVPLRDEWFNEPDAAAF